MVTSQNPGQSGEVITFYGTGFGPVAPLPATGALAAASPLSTMDPTPVLAIGGHDAALQFAGLTPGFAGLYQFNAIIPSGLGGGDLPVLMSVGGQLSNLVSIPLQGPPGVSSDLIRDGSFSAPFGMDWTFYVGLGAAATVERPASSGYDGNFSAQISVTTAATTAAAAAVGAPTFAGVQFWQAALPLTQGATYQLQFWAKSGSARSMMVSVFKDSGDHHSYGLTTTFSLGGDWQQYTIDFQATETASDGELVFFFGDQTGDVWLEGVSMIPLIGL